MTQHIRFDQPHVASPELRNALNNNIGAARSLASANAAEAISDLGVLDLADGDLQQAIARFQQALRLDPTARAGFHNLLAALLGANALRGANFDALRSHLLEHWHDLPWRDEYISLLVQPKFLNLEFVQGKCNLKCRMCIGVNAKSHPNKLSYIDVSEIAAMLDAAPTITGITLSSGDSDPLLHPQFIDVLDVAVAHGVRVDLYTNGLPLSAKTARKIIDRGAVSMINFSIDAATAATYERIRGGDFDKVIRNVRMLSEMRHAAPAPTPSISLSFVAMRDNVAELPSFVHMASELGAQQVIVDDLSGWRDAGSGNEPATAEPNCIALLSEAATLAAEHGLRITFHERLEGVIGGAKRQAEGYAASHSGDDQLDTHLNNGTSIDPVASESSGGIAAHLHEITRYIKRKTQLSEIATNPQAQSENGPDETSTGENPIPQKSPTKKLACCGWIDGVWVGGDGALHPCCMVRSPVDMGHIHEGPLLTNERYLNVKRDLLAGKVFRRCTTQRMCSYVQQQLADHHPFELIDEESNATKCNEAHTSMPHDTIMSLPVLA